MEEDDPIRIRMLVLDRAEVVITSESMIVRAAAKARGFQRYRVHRRQRNGKLDALGKTRIARWSKSHPRRGSVVERLGFEPGHRRGPRDPLVDRRPEHPILLLNTARLIYTDHPLSRMNRNHPRMKYQQQTVDVDRRFIAADLRVRAYPVLESSPSRGLALKQARLLQSMLLLVQRRSCRGGQTA